MSKRVSVSTDFYIEDYWDEFWEEVSDDDLITELQDRGLSFGLEKADRDDLIEALCGQAQSIVEADKIKEALKDIQWL